MLKSRLGRSALVVIMVTAGLLVFYSLGDAADQAAETREAVARALEQARVKPGTSCIGRKVPPFVLPDATGKQIALSDFAEAKLVILVSLSTGCPISNLYLPALIEAQKTHGTLNEAGFRNLQIIGINSQSGDTAEEVAEHIRKFQINFPVLRDPDQTVADQLTLLRTAETFLLDQQRTIRYHGRIDDRYRYTTRAAKATRDDLKIAATELFEGHPVSVPETPVEGCLISRAARTKPEKGVTFHKDVQAILQNRCQECHHPGTAAPFSLLTYNDAVSWSAMIKEVVVQQRMPPWHADPRHNEFANDRRLSATERQTLMQWIDDGTPAGKPEDAPAARHFAEGWRIGTPDVVFELPKEVSIPADGTVPYQYFTTETNFQEDMWIEAAEARPGNRAVVHHIIVFFMEPGDKRAVRESNWIVAHAPGDEPLHLPSGVGRKIPAGSKLIWQMHYTPTGKAETDKSQVAFKFCKSPPQKVSRVFGIDNQRFAIPAGSPHHRVQARHTVQRPVTLLACMPHMHLRGKAFEYRATFPDGKEEVLLSVPQFDFNWQTSYRFKNPITLPSGTKIQCTAYFDNSSGNPANPNPDQKVFWGDQTWEEMMIGYLDYIEE